MNIIEILTRAKELAASDIHLTVGCPLFFAFGVLKPQKSGLFLLRNHRSLMPAADE